MMSKNLKYSLVFIAIALVGFGIYFFAIKSEQYSAHSKAIYTCPMHPEIIRNEPGNCPICKMHLVELKTEDKALTSEELKNITLPTDKYIVGNYTTIIPIDTTIIATITLPGIVEYNPNSAITIAARTSGRLEKMNVKYKFQSIQKGEKLFEIYSPELLTEQQNFLYIIKNDQENKSLINASVQKLLLFGMTKSQINKLEKSGNINPSIAIYSPISGIVIDAGNNEMNPQSTMNSNINSATLDLKEGSYIQKNTPVFKIQSTDKVWGIFNVLQEYNSQINLKTPIQITSELNNQSLFSGKVDFIETQLVSNEKTNRIRVYLDNTTLKLPIGTRLNGTLQSNKVKGIFINKESFITLGNKQVVFIKTNQYFYAKEIQIGFQTNEYVQVLSGLNLKDTIAENAQYLTDSESFIKIKE